MTAHESLNHQPEIQGSSDRSFGAVFTLVFLAVGGWSWWQEGRLLIWAFVAAGVFALTAIFKPALLHPLNRLWMRLGLLLNRIVSPVFLAVIFFLAVTPVGLLMRLFGKDLLRLKFQPNASSYWIPRTPPGPDPQTMPRQF
ncbi:MAG: hypothetical protein ACE5ER_09655 [Nitrospinaceae bacterium]